MRRKKWIQSVIMVLLTGVGLVTAEELTINNQTDDLSRNHGDKQLSIEQHKALIKKRVTQPGPYAADESWPKDYFLISKNLPYFVGLLLYNSGGEVIGLSKEQIADLHEIRNRTVPAVLEIAVQIKEKELLLAQKLIEKKMNPKELYGLVDEIAHMRADLTKEHLDCIHAVQQIINDDTQYATLLKHAQKKSINK